MGKLVIGAGARAGVLAGARKLCDAVRVTLGPKGRNVLLSDTGVITNDGVTIARAVKLEDEVENLGASILRQASARTNDLAGDGTTSAIVLGAEILDIASRRIGNGASPVVIKNGLLKAGEIVTEWVEKQARERELGSVIEGDGERGKGVSDEQLLAVITNSCASEANGKILFDAVKAVGVDGQVIIEENGEGATRVTLTDGLECPLVMSSPYFAQNPARLEYIANDARVAVCGGAVASMNELVGVLELARQEGWKLVIIAPEFEANVVAGLVLNRVRAGVDVVALTCSRGDSAVVLGDVAAAVGARIVDGEVGVEDLGRCEKVVANMRNTKFILGGNHPASCEAPLQGGEDFEGKKGGRDLLGERVAQIRGQMGETSDAYLLSKLRERLARLTARVAVVSVGCASPVETHEAKLRFDDALMAATVAREHGVVAGGGVTYVLAGRYLGRVLRGKGALGSEARFSAGEREGAEVLREALPCVLRQICENADVDAGVVLARVGARGYDAMRGRFVDMFEARIIDPAFVITNVVRNAVSVAVTLLTTEAVV